MNTVLLIALISYVIVAITFNLAMLSFYKEEKDQHDIWSGDEFCDKAGMFLVSAFWPIPVIYGLFKIKKEGK